MKEKLLNDLIKIEAIKIKTTKDDWFTWSSGIKSPIYCDNRLTISYPKIRKKLSNDLIKLIKENFAEVEYIAGTSTAGIPQASWISDSLNLPLVYVRNEMKKHGQKKQIEGKIEAGKKVVIIEDLISTAKSLINVFNALKSSGFKVIGSVAIFSYNLKRSSEVLDKVNLIVKTLTNYDELIKFLTTKDLIKDSQAKMLLEWRNSL